MKNETVVIEVKIETEDLSSLEPDEMEDLSDECLRHVLYFLDANFILPVGVVPTHSLPCVKGGGKAQP